MYVFSLLCYLTVHLKGVEKLNENHHRRTIDLFDVESLYPTFYKKCEKIDRENNKFDRYHVFFFRFVTIFILYESLTLREIFSPFPGAKNQLFV